MADRRERRKLHTRTALLESAMALFTERGIHAARLEDITERADLGKGAFYNYFESKDALVAELVAEGIGRLERDYLGPIGTAWPERVTSVVQAHEAFFRDHPEYVMLFHQARGILKVRSAGADNLRNVFRRHLDLVSRAALAGGGPEVAEDVRLDLGAAIVGAVSGYLSFCTGAGLQPRPTTVERALLLGLPAALRAPDAGP